VVGVPTGGLAKNPANTKVAGRTGRCTNCSAELYECDLGPGRRLQARRPAEDSKVWRVGCQQTGALFARPPFVGGNIHRQPRPAYPQPHGLASAGPQTTPDGRWHISFLENPERYEYRSPPSLPPNHAPPCLTLAQALDRLIGAIRPFSPASAQSVSTFDALGRRAGRRTVRSSLDVPARRTTPPMDGYAMPLRRRGRRPGATASR